MRRFALALAACIVAATAAASARDASVPISLRDLGDRDAITINGVYPSFQIDLPQYRTLRAATVHFHVHLSPLADPKSYLQILVGDRPILTRTLRESGRDAHLDAAIPLVPGRTGTLPISLRGYQFITGDVCADLQTQGLFVTIDPDSRIDVRQADDATANFFRDYRTEIEVVAHGDPAAAALPYQLAALEPWHQPVVRLVDAPQRGRRTIVLGGTAGSLERRGDVLTATPGTLAQLVPQPGPSPDGRIAFSQIGVPSRSATGLGALTFELPFATGAIGGVPQDLHLHLGLAHTPLVASTSGSIQVQVNGTLVGSREMRRAGTTEELDIAVPAAAVGPTNDVKVIASYFVGPGSCQGSLPTITTTLLGSSYFSWHGLDPEPRAIDAFVKGAHGHVALLLDPAYLPAATHLTALVRQLNGTIATLDASRFDGTIPSGVDAAIIVAAPDKLANVTLPVRPDARTFRIVNPISNAVVYTGRPGDRVATLQLGHAGTTPVLAVSFSGDARALDRLDALDAQTLGAQLGNVAIADADGVTSYDVGQKLRVFYETEDPLSRVWSLVRLPLAVVLIVLIVWGVVVASRRLARRAG